MKGQPTDTLWLDLDVTLRVLDQVYGQAIESLEVNVVEWYVLRALYTQDGQRPSDLARALGRAQTAFTPILDKIEVKGLIERRANARDRRSIQIYLTGAGKALQDTIQNSATQIDAQVRSAIPDETWRHSRLCCWRCNSLDAKPSTSHQRSIWRSSVMVAVKLLS